MRGPLTWIVGVAVGLVLMLVVTALIGDRDKRGETVTAGEWAQSVCGSVAVWRGELEAIVEDIRTPNAASTAGEEPQSETPQGRTGFIRKGLERSVQAAETLVEGIDNAGIPDTSQGEEAAGQVSEWPTPHSTTSSRRRTPSTRKRSHSRSRSSSWREPCRRSEPSWPPECRRWPRSRASIPSSRPRSAPRAPCEQLREETS